MADIQFTSLAAELPNLCQFLLLVIIILLAYKIA